MKNLALVLLCTAAALMIRDVSMSQTNTTTVWGEIKYVFPSGLKLGIGVPTGVVISLVGSGYNKSITTVDAISSALKSGKFLFSNVPYEKSK